MRTNTRTRVGFLGALLMMLPMTTGHGQSGPGSPGWSQLAHQIGEDTFQGLSLRGDPCAATARVLLRASINDLRAGLAVAMGNCLNLPDFAERRACQDEAWEEYLGGLEEVCEQYDARLDVCDLLGGGVYHPDIDPNHFQTEITNPFLPFTVGSTWTLQKDTDEGLEEIVILVTDDTIDIEGVVCTVVRDTVTLDGVLVEDTLDYYAQDLQGNVWYFGEIALNYEDGRLADIAGSWRYGQDRAQPGIVMPAHPSVDSTYRQEFLLNEAEDMATVLALDAAVSVFYGDFSDCLQSLEFTALSPGALEYKFYAVGIGLVLEENPATGERTELISFTPGT